MLEGSGLLLVSNISAHACCARCPECPTVYVSGNKLWKEIYFYHGIFWDIVAAIALKSVAHV
jgi:hypothetical protein